jgi:hypothetical protein
VLSNLVEAQHERRAQFQNLCIDEGVVVECSENKALLFVAVVNTNPHPLTG